MPDEMSRPLVRGRGGCGLLEASECEPGSPVVGILGTGDFSRSLTRRLVASGYQVVVGSRNPKRFQTEDAEVTSQLEAATHADLVFVAVFPEHHSTLLQLKPALVGKVLVDVSNALQMNRDGPSNAGRLADMFPESYVVKGFNTISAWTLQVGPRDGSRQVFLCSNSQEAKSSVMRVCRKMGFVPVDAGPLSSALDIENLPFHLFPSWHLPILCTLCLFLFFYLYNFSRDVLQPYFAEGKSYFYKMPIDTVNATFPSVAMVMLALVYLPGVCAAVLQLWRGTKYERFPDWLDRWLSNRKQFGLCSFLCAALHAVYSLCLPERKSSRYKMLNAAFKQVRDGVEDSWVNEEVWRMELYLSAGILALGLLSLLAVTSLPSVANTVNWREFSFIQSTLGYCALTVATLHTLLFGWDRAFSAQQYRLHLPPTFVLVLVLPLLVLLGRLVLCVPCAALRLRMIRRGWERNRHVRFARPDDDCGNGLDDHVSNV